MLVNLTKEEFRIGLIGKQHRKKIDKYIMQALAEGLSVRVRCIRHRAADTILGGVNTPSHATVLTVCGYPDTYSYTRRVEQDSEAISMDIDQVIFTQRLKGFTPHVRTSKKG